MLFLIPLLLFFQPAMARPKKLQVWFLKEATVSARAVPLPSFPSAFGPWLTANDYDPNCVPMGDGCFHPQTGFHMKGEGEQTEKPKEDGEEKAWAGKVFNSADVSLVDCKQDYFFDIYCGKESPVKSGEQELEVWFDNSASLKSIDPPGSGDYCHRRTFAEKLRNTCGAKNVLISVYNTSMKTVSDLSVICDHRGANSEERLIRWISESESKDLVVVTDIAEYSDKFEIFLHSMGAEIHGMGVKSIHAKDLDGMIKSLAPHCAP